MSDQYDFKTLLKKYRQGSCNEKEKAIIESWLLNRLEKGNIYPDVDKQLQKNTEMWQSINRRIERRAGRKVWTTISVAASVLLLAFAGAWHLKNVTLKPTTPEILAGNDLVPGGNNAVLTLANGKRIDLSQIKVGIIAGQGQFTIVKQENGLVLYHAINSGKRSLSADTGYNSFTTPRGGEYKLILPDGSAVWLNAESSITYPVSFAVNKRVVKITGEAYFEVTKDVKRPFWVESAHQRIEVLGTHFDVNAYSDESLVKTTLLEGKVKVTAGNNSTLIVPGEESDISGNNIAVHKVDVRPATAWIDGEFMFRNESLESIMRKVARWYNVSIVYENEQAKKELFGGAISRFHNASDVLQMLELTGSVHFKIDERRIIVI